MCLCVQYLNLVLTVSVLPQKWQCLSYCLNQSSYSIVWMLGLAADHVMLCGRARVTVSTKGWPTVTLSIVLSSFVCFCLDSLESCLTMFSISQVVYFWQLWCLVGFGFFPVTLALHFAIFSIVTFIPYFYNFLFCCLFQPIFKCSIFFHLVNPIHIWQAHIGWINVQITCYIHYCSVPDWHVCGVMFLY